jgi:hypothetical protein
VINDGSEITFYWVSEEAISEIENLPYYHDQLGGFDRSHITIHIPELEPFIKETDLEGITLNDLLEKHAIKKFNCLHIDTEGADYQILLQLDLSKYRPEVILYERKHLSEEERLASVKYLQSCYSVYNLGDDFLAIEHKLNNGNKAILRKLQDYLVSSSI